MNMSHRLDVTGVGTYPDIISQNSYTTDLNRVYIPFRSILEAELMTSGILALRNYEYLSNISFKSLDMEKIMEELELDENHLFSKILARFFIVVHRLVPIASRLGPNRRNELRYGNVNAYTESRIPLFYAVDRFKVKILILRNFFHTLRRNHYNLKYFPSYVRKEDKSLYSILFAEYYERMLKYFQTVVWEPTYKKKYLNTYDDVNFRVLYELHSFRQRTSVSKINYIIRGLKSSLFVSKLLFQVCDIPQPFETANGAVESLILNRDFIPGMINIMNMAYRIGDMVRLREIVEMFLAYLDKILQGINHGVFVASNQQMELNIDETIYYIGDILEFD
ncbi:MAG: hypothetical protein ACTSWC_05275 [Promethearchaeota archaeon]